MRIKSLDGLRALAVTGVIWAHAWMFVGTPAFLVSSFNIAQIISFFGTGVDLFFVISGFCMYYMFSGKQPEITFGYFIGYLKKRWLRIAPLYYFGVVVYASFAANFSWFSADMWYALKDLLFIRNLSMEKTLYAPHFWSLGTEFHFYILLPLILWFFAKSGFRRTMIILFATCIFIRAMLWINPSDDYNLKNYLIFNRLIEFITGIWCARVFLSGSKNKVFSSLFGFFFGFAIAFAGRLLMTENMISMPGMAGWLSRVFNLPLLAIGYGIVLVNVISSSHIFSRIFSYSWASAIGKYSYSMYVWHWLILEVVYRLINPLLQAGSFSGAVILFAISMIITVPVSKLSFNVLESFYFRYFSTNRKNLDPIKLTVAKKQK